MNPGDLVEPHWKKGHECDYFDVLPQGYCTWKKGELGVVLSVTNRKPRKESSCEILLKGKLIISFLFEMNVISESPTAQEDFKKFQQDLYEDTTGE